MIWFTSTLVVSVTAGLAVADGTPSATGSAWAPRAQHDGISVEAREVAGSDYAEVRASVELPVGAGAVLAALLDVPGQVRWVHALATSRLLRRDSADAGLTFHRYVYPWPIGPREVAIAWRLERLPAGGGVLHMRGDRDALELSADGVAIERLEGSIRAEALAPARTRVTYQVYTEPGGRLPAWLANRRVTELPLESLRGLRRILVSEGATR